MIMCLSLATTTEREKEKEREARMLVPDWWPHNEPHLLLLLIYLHAEICTCSNRDLRRRVTSLIKRLIGDPVPVN